MVGPSRIEEIELDKIEIDPTYQPETPAGPSKTTKPIIPADLGGTSIDFRPPSQQSSDVEVLGDETLEPIDQRLLQRLGEIQAERDRPINKAAMMRFLERAAVHSTLKGPAKEANLQAMVGHFYEAQGLNVGEIEAGAKTAGRCKNLHNIPTDLLGLVPSAIFATLKSTSLDPVNAAIINLALQLVVQVANPFISTRNMVPILQVMQQHRVGVSKRFGATGTLDQDIKKLQTGTNALKKMNRQPVTTLDGQAVQEQIAQLEEDLSQYDDSYKLNAMRYSTLLPENMVRMFRATMLVAGLWTAVAVKQKDSQLAADLPTAFMFQLVSVLSAWALHWFWAGPKGELLLETKGLEADLEKFGPEIARSLVGRQLNKQPDFGPGMATDIREIESDVQAETAFRNLWKGKEGSLLTMAKSLFVGEQKIILQEYAKLLDMPLNLISRRAEILERLRTSSAADNPLELTDLERDLNLQLEGKAEASDSKLVLPDDEIRELLAIKIQIDEKRDDLPLAKRVVFNDVEAALDRVVNDIAFLKQEKYTKISDQRKATLDSVLARNVWKTSRQLSGHINKQFVEMAPHAIQKYSKGFQLIFGGSPTALSMAAFNNLMAARGNPIDQDLRIASSVVPLFIVYMAELVGGKLVTYKNEIRADWRERYKHEPPSLGAKVGLSIKSFLTGAVCVPIEAKRLLTGTYVYSRAQNELAVAKARAPSPLLPITTAAAAAAALTYTGPGPSTFSAQERQLYEHIYRTHGLEKYSHLVPEDVLRVRVLQLARQHGINTIDEFKKLSRAAGFNDVVRFVMAGVALGTLSYGLGGLAGAFSKDIYDSASKWDDAAAQAHLIGFMMPVMGMIWTGLAFAGAAKYGAQHNLGPNSVVNHDAEFHGVKSWHFLKSELPYLAVPLIDIVLEEGLGVHEPDQLVTYEFALRRLALTAVSSLTTAALKFPTQLEHKFVGLKEDRAIESALSTKKLLENSFGGLLTGVPLATGKEVVKWSRDMLSPTVELRHGAFWDGVVSQMAGINLMMLVLPTFFFATATSNQLASAVSGGDQHLLPDLDRLLPDVDPHSLRQYGHLASFMWLFRKPLYHAGSSAEPEGAQTHGVAANAIKNSRMKLNEALLVQANNPTGWAPQDTNATDPTNDVARTAETAADTLANPQTANTVQNNAAVYTEYVNAKKAYWDAHTAFQLGGDTGDWARVVRHLNDLTTAVGNMDNDQTVGGDGTATDLNTALTNLNNALADQTGANNQAAAAFGALDGNAVMPGATSPAHDLWLAAKATFDALPNSTPAMLSAVKARVASDNIATAQTSLQTALTTRDNLYDAPDNDGNRAALTQNAEVLAHDFQALLSHTYELIQNPALAADPSLAPLVAATGTLKAILSAGKGNASIQALTLTVPELINAATALMVPPDGISKTILAELIEARLLTTDTTKKLSPADLMRVMAPILRETDAANFHSDGSPAAQTVVDRIKYQSLSYQQMLDLSKEAASMAADPVKAEVLKLITERVASDERRPANASRIGTGEQCTELLKPWLHEYKNARLAVGERALVDALVVDLLSDASLDQADRDGVYSWFKDIPGLDGHAAHTMYAAGYNGRGLT